MHGPLYADTHCMKRFLGMNARIMNCLARGMNRLPNASPGPLNGIPSRAHVVNENIRRGTAKKSSIAVEDQHAKRRNQKRSQLQRPCSLPDPRANADRYPALPEVPLGVGD